MGFDPSTLTNTSTTRWWFQIFLIFTLTWGRFPIWLLFFRWVETTNQTIMSVYHSLLSRPWSLDRFGFTRIHWSPDSQPRERTVFQSPCQRFCCALSRFKFAFFVTWMAWWHQILLTVLIELRYLISTTMGRNAWSYHQMFNHYILACHFLILKGRCIGIALLTLR